VGNVHSPVAFIAGYPAYELRRCLELVASGIKKELDPRRLIIYAEVLTRLSLIPCQRRTRADFMGDVLVRSCNTRSRLWISRQAQRG
jgi:hypothetical protein